MDIAECLPFDELFTHIEDETGKVRHFNPSAMYRALPELLPEGRVKAITAELDKGFVSHILAKCGVEDEKLGRMKDPYLHVPVIGVDMEDGTVLMVDGHHRLVVLAARGEETYRMYLFPIGVWERFLVDMPGEINGYLVQDVLAQLSQPPRRL